METSDSFLKLKDIFQLLYFVQRHRRKVTSLCLFVGQICTSYCQRVAQQSATISSGFLLVKVTLEGTLHSGQPRNSALDSLHLYPSTFVAPFRFAQSILQIFQKETL
jgi:hypothetical protein